MAKNALNIQKNLSQGFLVAARLGAKTDTRSSSFCKKTQPKPGQEF